MSAPPTPPGAGSEAALTMAQAFEARAASRELVIGVLGLGYVGLPLAEGFIGKGFRVLAYDPDPAKVAAIGEGRSYIKHISGDRIAAMTATGRLEATTDEARLGVADALLMCVPTPLNAHREPDLSYVADCAKTIARPTSATTVPSVGFIS